MGAEGAFERNFSRIETDAGLKPDPSIIDQRDQTDRRGKHPSGGVSRMP
jgi:hypothetical protein